MLRSVRQVRSFPSLRQATAYQASVSPQLQQQRSLASTVLLTSWTQARVPDLKEELKKRGLSTAGKKAELVGRLTQHESAQSKMPSTRAASTKATEEKPVRLADSEIEAITGDEISAVNGAVRVSSQLQEDLPTAEEFGESPTEAPGLPENPGSDKPATFDFQLPDGNLPEPGTPIPWILAFNSDKFPSSTSSPSQAAPQEPHVPKLFTTADPSTHLGGGPSAALSTPISTDPMKTDAVVEAGADHPNRKLNADERRGLYVLAGILAAGFGLSTLANPKVRKAAKKLERDAERLAHEGKEKAESLLHGGKDKAESLLHKGQAKGEDVLAKGKNKVEEGKDKAEALLAKGQAKGEKALEKGKAKVEEGKNKAEKAAAEAKAKGEELLAEGKAKGEKALAKGEKAAAEAKGEAKRVAKGVKDE